MRLDNSVIWHDGDDKGSRLHLFKQFRAPWYRTAFWIMIPGFRIDDSFGNIDDRFDISTHGLNDRGHMLLAFGGDGDVMIREACTAGFEAVKTVHMCRYANTSAHVGTPAHNGVSQGKKGSSTSRRPARRKIGPEGMGGKTPQGVFGFAPL